MENAGPVASASISGDVSEASASIFIIKGKTGIRPICARYSLGRDVNNDRFLATFRRTACRANVLDCSVCIFGLCLSNLEFPLINRSSADRDGQ